MSEAQTMPAKQQTVITVTPRQVKAAQIAVKGHKRLGRPVPPGLERISRLERTA